MVNIECGFPDTYNIKNFLLRLLGNAATKLQALVQSGAEEYEAWNRCTVQLVQAAKVSTNPVFIGHTRYGE